jgi:hypothetical protein
VLSTFQQACPQAILHTGDVSTPLVLRQLEQVAPVFAVRGNRDIFLLRQLPLARRLSFHGAKIGLTHGHAPWRSYLLDRFYFKIHGYDHARLIPRLVALFPDVDVIIFGHGHLCLNEWRHRQLLFNPGSPHFPAKKGLDPSVGLLHITAQGEVHGEILYLP